MNRIMSNKEIKIKQELFFKSDEFKPLLTKEQYKIYVKHIEFVIDFMKNKEIKKRGSKRWVW